jgi:hypothetical protein
VQKLQGLKHTQTQHGDNISLLYLIKKGKEAKNGRVDAGIWTYVSGSSIRRNKSASSSPFTCDI